MYSMKSIEVFCLLFLCQVICCLSTGTFPQVKCSTTKGDIIIEVYEDLAPLGAEHFLELIADNFYTNIAFYRCVDHFLTQFGISENPSKKDWHGKQILDDINLHKGIHKHDVSFAGGGPNTRSTQLFIAFEDLDFLGKEPWETPFGKVIKGHEVLDQLYKGYGDISPFNKNGPDQQKLFHYGNAYIHKNFPKIDFIHECSIINNNINPSLVDPVSITNIDIDTSNKNDEFSESRKVMEAREEEEADFHNLEGSYEKFLKETEGTNSILSSLAQGNFRRVVEDEDVGYLFIIFFITLTISIIVFCVRMYFGHKQTGKTI